MKTLCFYPKVRTVGHREIERLLDGPVIVQEKVDGSNFTFGCEGNGQAFVYSHSQVLDFNKPEKMFEPAIVYVDYLAKSGRLPLGTAFRCEYLRTPKHNVQPYERVPKNNLILFEVLAQSVTGEWDNMTASRQFLETMAAEVDIDVVPEFFRGTISLDELVQRCKETWFTQKSCLGLSRIEGVVVKNTAHFNEWGHILVGKLVRKEFQEQQAHNKRLTNPDPVAKIGAQFGGPARWNKAVQFLTERGELKEGPEDIPSLMHQIQRDVEEECKPEIMEALWKQFKGAIYKGCRAGFAEWYKAKINPVVAKMSSVVELGGGRIDTSMEAPIPDFTDLDEQEIDQLGLKD